MITPEQVAEAKRRAQDAFKIWQRHSTPHYQAYIEATGKAKELEMQYELEQEHHAKRKEP